MPKRQVILNHCSVDVIHHSPQVVPPSFVYTKSNYSSKFIAANFLSLKSELNFTSIKIFSEVYFDSRINVIPSPGAKISAKVDKNQQKSRTKKSPKKATKNSTRNSTEKSPTHSTKSRSKSRQKTRQRTRQRFGKKLDKKVAQKTQQKCRHEGRKSKGNHDTYWDP